MNKRSRQIPLLETKEYACRKQVRPISVRSPNHVIFKARLPVLRANHRMIRQVIQETQRRFGIRIRSIAIMENHVHFLWESSSRVLFQNALRFFAGQVALKLKRGSIWMERVWSRVVRWGKDFLGVKDYIDQNPLKAGIFDEIDVFVIRRGILMNSS